MAALVAIGIYVWVPPFVPVFASLGADMPLSGRILVASYPFAFLLPLVSFTLGMLLKPASRWRRLLVPLTYLVSIGVVCFVALALYVPMFELG